MNRHPRCRDSHPRKEFALTRVMAGQSISKAEAEGFEPSDNRWSTAMPTPPWTQRGHAPQDPGDHVRSNRDAGVAAIAERPPRTFGYSATHPRTRAYWGA